MVTRDERPWLSNNHAKEELVLIVDAENWGHYPHYDEMCRATSGRRKRARSQGARKTRIDAGRKKQKRPNSQKPEKPKPLIITPEDSDSDSSDSSNSSNSGNSSDSQSEDTDSKSSKSSKSDK